MDFNPFDDITDALGEFGETPPLVIPKWEPPNKPEWLYDYCQEIIGFEDMAPQPHYEMCGFIEEALGDCQFEGMQHKAYMLLISRGTFKTSIVCEGAVTGILIKNPNARILIATHKEKTSGKRIQAVKRHFQFNQEFHKKYGDDWKPEFREYAWSEKSITVSRRTKVLREPSVEAGAVGVDMTGSHYDAIFVDDPVQRENSRTLDQRDKVHEYIMSLFALLDPGGILFLVGTRWHPDDAYGRIEKTDKAREEKGKPPFFKKLIRSCYDGPGGLLFPTRLDHEFLEEARSRDARLFAANYENKPVADADKTFKAEHHQVRDWQYYYTTGNQGIVRTAEDQWPVSVTMRWDTAGTKGTGKSDFHGITVVGTDCYNRWWILASCGIKGPPSEIIAKVVSLIQVYRPRDLGIEATGAFGHWLERLQPLLDRYGLQKTTVFEWQHGGIPKEERIEMLEPLWTSRSIFMQDDQTSLWEQIDSFSMQNKLAHDDELDSLAMHIGGTEPAGEAERTIQSNPRDPELNGRRNRSTGQAFSNILLRKRY